MTSQPDLASNYPNFVTYKEAHFFQLQLEDFFLANINQGYLPASANEANSITFCGRLRIFFC